MPYSSENDEVVGSEQQVVDGVLTEGYGAAHYAVGGDGILAYVPGEAISGERELVWVSRSGEVEEVVLTGREYMTPRLSPDGSRVAMSVVEGANIDVWVLELARGAFTRRTTHPGEDFYPVWNSDGTVMAFASEIGEDQGEVGPAIASMPVSGDQAQQLFSSPEIGSWDFPGSFSPDDEWLSFTARRSGRAADAFILPMSEPRDPIELAATPANERAPMFSPNGHWVAYVSDESGRDEIYARSFPGPGPSTLISTDGGGEPMWSKDGRELFYRSGNRMMAVEVSQGSEIAPSVPLELFAGLFDRRSLGGEFANYDVSSDGLRFLMVRRRSSASPNVIQVVLDWPSLLSGPTD